LEDKQRTGVRAPSEEPNSRHAARSNASIFRRLLGDGFYDAAEAHGSMQTLLVAFRYFLAAFGAAIPVACTLAVDAGELQEGCPTGQKECFGQCVSVNDRDFGCAGSSCTPCTFPGATSRCGSDGECALGVCTGSNRNCNQDESDGCEVDIDIDPLNCNECGEVCQPFPNSEPACGNGTCSIARCLTGFRDCDGDRRNGCEADLSKSTNCGGCGVVCEGGTNCEELSFAEWECR